MLPRRTASASRSRPMRSRRSAMKAFVIASVTSSARRNSTVLLAKTGTASVFRWDGRTPETVYAQPETATAAAAIAAARDLPHIARGRIVESVELHPIAEFITLHLENLRRAALVSARPVEGALDDV